jgi:hypothetical protein
MPPKEKTTRFNLLNIIVNILIILLPFQVIISGYSQQLNLGLKLELIYGILACLIILVTLRRINWSIAYKINKFLITSVVLVTIIAIVSSLVINITTSNLFLLGFNSEIIPLVLMVVLYIYSQQNQFVFNRSTKVILFASIVITNLFFLISNLNNLPVKVSEVISTNPNYYGLLNLLYLAILTSIYIKSNSEYKYWIRIASASIIFLQLIFSPLIALFSIAAVTLLIVKRKYPNLVLTRYIVLIAFMIALGIGFLSNLSGLNYVDYVNTVRRDVMIGNNAKLHNLYGYGLGNTDKIGKFNYGSNYSKFLSRPLIIDNKENKENKELIPNVELGIVQLLVSGGVIYTLLYFGILINIAYKQARSSYYFYPILIIILTSTFFNPLSFLPIFYILALSSLLVL